MYHRLCDELKEQLREEGPSGRPRPPLHVVHIGTQNTHYLFLMFLNYALGSGTSVNLT